MEELHTVRTALGYVIIAVDPELRTVRWVEPAKENKKPYTARQSAFRRREQLERENEMKCGYCKCDPCQCDGHGNFGPVENVSWYPAGLDSEVTAEEINNVVEEGPLTYEDGTPVPESHERRLRVDERSPERSWRPQRPRF